MWKIIKQIILDDAAFYALLIISVGVASFGLGRLSMMPAQDEASDTARFGTPADISEKQDSTPTPPAAENVQVVAAQGGSRYYALWCAGVSRIKEENKVYFNNPAEARAAGYTPAVNCEGIK